MTEPQTNPTELREQAKALRLHGLLDRWAQVIVTLIEAYEAKHYDFGPVDPVEAIKFRMEQEGLSQRDLEPYIGQSGRVSEVLNRKRALSLRMVKRLHDGLRIPYESLLAGVR